MLTLIIIGLIAGVGYFVWHSKDSAIKNLDNANNSSSIKTSSGVLKVTSFDECSKTTSSKIQLTYPEVCLTNDGKSFTQPASQNYFVIKEWAVRAPYSGLLHLTYSISANSADFSSRELVGRDSRCSATNLSGGIIARYTASEAVDPAGDTAASYYRNQSEYAPMTKIGSYYYLFNHTQAACSDSGPTTDELQMKTNNAVKTLVQNLAAAPQ